jgi:hypothetical protein
MKFRNSMNLGMLMIVARTSAGKRYLMALFLKDLFELMACSWWTKKGWQTARYLKKRGHLSTEYNNFFKGNSLVIAP